MSIADVQRRLRELGRIRIGEKDERGFPRRLDVFRLTSPSLELLRFASGQWGGVPTEWPGAPGEGTQYELVTETDVLEVYVPRQDVAGKQLLELYTKGGVQRRCDGTTELRSGRACMCDPEDRACTPTTHVLFILPQIPDLGTWRLTTRGWNAAAELPATVEFLGQVSASSAPPLATLAIETRTSVVDGKTKHYSVPVLRVPYTLVELRRGGVPLLEGGRGGRPPIAGEVPELPDDPSFAGQPPLGDAPALPVGDGGYEAEEEEPESSGAPSVDTVVQGQDTPSPTTQSGGEGIGVPAPSPEPPDSLYGAGESLDSAGDDGSGSGGIPTGETTGGPASLPVASGSSGEAPLEPTVDEQTEALHLLIAVTEGNLSRAASYVNRANKTRYTKTSIGTATVDELRAGIEEADRR